MILLISYLLNHNSVLDDNNELYLLINVAIENTIDPGFETGQMEIDYVRVYAPDSKPDDLPVWFDEFN